jgi:PilZ domain
VAAALDDLPRRRGTPPPRPRRRQLVGDRARHRARRRHPHFPATIVNVSLSGVLLEAKTTANLWADKPVAIDLPGGVGTATATVRRFLAYGRDGTKTSRWGIELTDLTLQQRALWSRFIYTAAREAGHALASIAVHV